MFSSTDDICKEVSVGILVQEIDHWCKCRMNYYGVIDVVEIVPTIILTFIISVTISIGRSVTCSNLTEHRYER